MNSPGPACGLHRVADRLGEAILPARHDRPDLAVADGRKRLAGVTEARRAGSDRPPPAG